MNFFKNTAIITLLSSSLVLSAPASADASTEENVGFGAGAVIGALAGGPIGLIIGATSGALIGNELNEGNEAKVAIHEQQEKHNTLHELLEQQEAEVARLEAIYDALEHKQLAQEKRIDLALQAGLDLNFRSGSDQLETVNLSKIQQIYSLLKSEPDLTIIVEGFTDKRGSEEDNMKLAEQRIHSVTASLKALGLADSRITTKAFGESQAYFDVNDPEGLSLDRRVTITFKRIKTKSTIASTL